MAFFLDIMIWSNKTGDKSVTIRVNDVAITDEAVFAEMQYHPSENRQEATDAAAKALLVREILRQEAVKQGLLGDGVDEDEQESAVMKLVEENVTAPEASDDICQRYYEQNKERFKAQDTGEILPFEAVVDKIRDYLHVRSVREGLRSYVLKLAEEMTIKGVDLNFI